jgi:hypothetical protein
MKKALKLAGGVLVVATVIGVPALVGIRPFIGPKTRPVTDRRFESSAARIEASTSFRAAARRARSATRRWTSAAEA